MSYTTNKMEKKYSLSITGILVLLLLGGLYRVTIFSDKITVEMPSEKCGTALFRVTKDDFTLKCGSRIAFQADTIVEYYKTYGTDEWVRNNRYVGRNKKSIDLSLVDNGDSFDIIRTTKYRKGTQSIKDGTLIETYTFTGDRIKISYDYQAENSAKHKITMRIKKQVEAYLDAFDPFGNTGIETSDSLSYEGFGNLLIDPTVSLITPTTGNQTYDEKDTVPLICMANLTKPAEESANVTLYWNATGGSLVANGTTDITENSTVTFSRVIPHQTTSPDFWWTCLVCNASSSGAIGSEGCVWASANYTVNPIYYPNDINITKPESEDLNLLNGSISNGNDWRMYVNYPAYVPTHNYDSIFFNWTHAGGHPDGGGNLTWNLTYRGTTTTTPLRNGFSFTNANNTVGAMWNVTNLTVDTYYVTLTACTRANSNLCVNDTTLFPIDVFNYDATIIADKIRFSPQPTVTKGAALGQTATEGIIKVDWLGNGAPDGFLNLSIELQDHSLCTTYYAANNNTYADVNVSQRKGVTLVNQTNITITYETEEDPSYIWLWADKASCGTTTTDFWIKVNVLT